MVDRWNRMTAYLKLDMPATDLWAMCLKRVNKYFIRVRMSALVQTLCNELDVQRPISKTVELIKTYHMISKVDTSVSIDTSLLSWRRRKVISNCGMHGVLSSTHWDSCECKSQPRLSGVITHYNSECMYMQNRRVFSKY